MIKNQGVYTTKCPECTRWIVMHVLADGSISPNKCSKCEAEFAWLEKGEERNTFVIVPKAEESKIAVTEEAEEPPKTDENHFESFQLNKKVGGKSFETLSSTKKAAKKSFKW